MTDSEMSSSALIQVIRIQKELIEILNNQFLNAIQMMNENNSIEKSVEILGLKEKICQLTSQLGKVTKMMAEHELSDEFKLRDKNRFKKCPISKLNHLP